MIIWPGVAPPSGGRRPWSPMISRGTWVETAHGERGLRACERESHPCPAVARTRWLSHRMHGRGALARRMGTGTQCTALGNSSAGGALRVTPWPVVREIGPRPTTLLQPTHRTLGDHAVLVHDMHAIPAPRRHARTTARRLPLASRVSMTPLFCFYPPLLLSLESHPQCAVGIDALGGVSVYQGCPNSPREIVTT